ncbi:MAG: FAD-dependent thymidylate synthase [Halobacteriales archaeon]|nr:FAD-dependent thymidylate synthase [Halobacteriales archaeon]
MQVEVLESTARPEELACRAARGDYSADWVGKENDFATVMDSVEGDTLEEKKETLIDHLMRSGHWGPFEHPTATFAVRGVSRTCMAQLTRHRHASFDVMSLRYVDLSGDDPLDERFAYPPSFEADETVSREGVEEIEMTPDERVELAEEVYAACMDAYERLVDAGVPKEDARMLLPLGTKVNLTFSMNARSIMHLLDMRLKADAQWEIRELSRRVLEECKEWMPYTFERYEEQHPFKLAP